MDPNETLREALELADNVLGEHRDVEDLEGEAVALAERVQALHRWLNGGGFLPDAWKR